MKNTIFFAVSAALFAACLVLDILGVVLCHTMQVILSVVLLTY